MYFKMDTKSKIDIIMRQTNYKESEAIQKLLEFNDDHLSVIREYMGISEQKQQKISSINQEIYRQLRKKHTSIMKDYEVRVEKGEAKKVF